MVLDKEEDKQILLEFIRTSTIKGEAVFTVVDLISRIQSASIGEPEMSVSVFDTDNPHDI